MATKHTPGPWAVDAVNSEALHDIVLGYFVPGGGHPILVGHVFSDDLPGPGNITDIEAERNAKLMAAAPDLLAACELALKRLGAPVTHYQDAYQALTAAIAKAK